MIYHELPIFIVCRMCIFIVFENNKGVIHDYFILSITNDTVLLMLLYFNSISNSLNRYRFRGIFVREMLLSNNLENNTYVTYICEATFQGLHN